METQVPTVFLLDQPILLRFRKPGTLVAGLVSPQSEPADVQNGSEHRTVVGSPPEQQPPFPPAQQVRPVCLDHRPQAVVRIRCAGVFYRSPRRSVEANRQENEIEDAMDKSFHTRLLIVNRR